MYKFTLTFQRTKDILASSKLNNCNNNCKLQKASQFCGYSCQLWNPKGIKCVMDCFVTYTFVLRANVVHSDPATILFYAFCGKHWLPTISLLRCCRKVSNTFRQWVKMFISNDGFMHLDEHRLRPMLQVHCLFCNKCLNTVLGIVLY